MKEDSGVNHFSIRLICADYYLSPPISELDISFSEFRGSEIKQLPILRIFGATPYGKKTCLHVHGVFPYLYIPCEDPNPEPKVTYQIANSLDKAINISLKQANSPNQHVYKVILVQGIPFYGFHTKAHQFYKIFFYNPSFVKRAADLLQSGAILGLSYQPHEAHINFVMQFFLDFNLYGMSFINMEYVKHRRKSNIEVISNEENYLPDSVPFTSCCEWEVDCLAQHILNRKDVINGNLGANPGLEALWDDEKQRLNNLNMTDNLMPTPTQLRDDVKATESHIHHSKKLLIKLAMYSELRNEISDSNMTLSLLNDTPVENQMSDNISVSNITESQRFSKMVYPAETPEENDVMNATTIILHHPLSVSSTNSTIKNLNDTYADLDDTVVDESIILQCSQSQNDPPVELDAEDIDFMNMLKDMENNVEKDSILGTQSPNIEDEAEPYQETDCFTETNVDENLILTTEKIGHNISNSNSPQPLSWQDSFWENIENISQLDGTWDHKDDFVSKPKKRLKIGLSKPQRQSLRNKKPESKSEINNEKVSTDSNESTAPHSTEKTLTPKRRLDLNKKLESLRNQLSPEKTPKSMSPKNTPTKLRNFEPLKVTVHTSPSVRRTRSRTQNLLRQTLSAVNHKDKLLLTPTKRIKALSPGKRLLFDIPSIRQFDSQINKMDNLLLNCDDVGLNDDFIDCRCNDSEHNVDLPMEIDDSSKVDLSNNECDIELLLKNKNSDLNKTYTSKEEIEDCYKKKYLLPIEDTKIIQETPFSPGVVENNEISLKIPAKSFQCDLPITSSMYDRDHNFFPEAGPSKYYQETGNNPNDSFSTINESHVDENDPGIVSFYNTTNYQDSSIFYEDVLNESVKRGKRTDKKNNKTFPLSNQNEYEHLKLWYDHTLLEDAKPKTGCDVINMKTGDIAGESRKVILRPKCLPPSRDYVISTMLDHNIPLCKNEQPFYSNYRDVRGQIEIGQMLLKLKSKNMAYLKPFVSSVPNVNSIETWREMIFTQNNMTQGCVTVKDLGVLLASNRACILTPAIRPPAVKAVRNWLRTMEDRKKEKILLRDAEKVNEKIVYCMPCSPGQEFNDSQIDTMTLSPFSPVGSLETVESTPPQGVMKKSDFNRERKISSDSTIKSTSKKSKVLNQPLRRLRPRTLGLSLPLKNRPSLDSGDSNQAAEGFSQGSNESDYIACGQMCTLDQSPILEKLSEDIESPILFKKNECTEPIKEKAIVEPASVEGQYESINISENLSATLGFKFSGENYQNVMTTTENEYLTTLVVEVLTSTRGEMNPDPDIDPVLAVFYSIKNDCPPDFVLQQSETGIIIAKDDKFSLIDNRMASACHLQGLNKKYRIIPAETEKDLFEKLLELIAKWDPDILCGYEVEMLSWGYLFQRGYVLDMNLASKISRVPPPNKSAWKKDSQEMNKEIKLIGRMMLNVWRLLRHEIALTSYTFESVMYHIMHERIPQFSYRQLYFWWNHPSGLLRSLTVEYYLTRVVGIIDILQQLDLIGRTSELARVFGIQWYEVLSRGSQFRVESMMIRLTRPRNFVLVSPSVQQRAAMKAPECLPLILEPESRFYSDPVIVLDFQSLYPSMMIAYNYCYSTCIGKVHNMGRDAPYEFGASQLCVPPKLLEKLHKKDLINWSPCGVGFIKPALRKGVLPIMLQDILNTRLMVKRAMKKHKDNKTLQKILHSRQLGLKLIANVTYGYTAANFSGRMPCIEVGDSVVAKGRETLERAIKMVENTPKWRARVVYGDTDSLFVLVPGRSRADAFDIGAEIAEAVTNDNPTPVKLKLEKIYQPCILQTKKRYVGYMYESKNQETPEYNAKGIETVRRDGCPATAKMLEKTIRILFESYDVSKVKSYVCKEFQKIIEGKCNIRDFIFAKEFRGMNAYKPTACVPALEIARRFKAADHRKEPREGERLPYVFVSGAPGQALLHLARSPHDLLEDTSLRLNHAYYITRVIAPPLNRCLSLIGADVLQWFSEMPRKQVQLYPILDITGKQSENKKSTISQYFAKVNCVSCECQTSEGVCRECLQKPQSTMLVLQNKMNDWQRKFNLMNKICQSCCGRATQTDCISIDCPVLFRLNTIQQLVDQIPFVLKIRQKLIDF